MSTFSVDMKSFSNITKKRLNTVVRMSAFDLFSAVVYSTPVDTGQLRNNWFASIGAPSAEQTTEVSPDGSVPVARIKAVLTGKDVVGDIWLANNSAYAHRIEYDNWSAKAPAGMVRINVIRWAQIVEANAKAAK